MAAAAATQLAALKAAVAAGDVAKASTLLAGVKARDAAACTPCGRGARCVAAACVARVRSSARLTVLLRQVALTAFASLPPLLEPSPSAAAELALARACGGVAPIPAPRSRRGFAPPTGDVFEQAVLLSVKARDDAAFERNFAQLKPYYTDARCVPRRCTLRGAARAAFARPASPNVCTPRLAATCCRRRARSTACWAST
jgi:hypothetical protein